MRVERKKVVEQTKWLFVDDIVVVCEIHFSHSFLGIYRYGDNSGYWGLGSIVSNSSEHIQGDEVSSINATGIIFAVRKWKVSADVDVQEWSDCRPRNCDTKTSVSHSGV